ncbi:MAG: DNA-binding protein [Thiomicrospira sp.]
MRELIFMTADKLHAEGQTVTQEKIRDSLGKGSYSTIGKYLREWRSQREDDSNLLRTQLPDVINEKGLLLIRALWREAVSLANKPDGELPDDGLEALKSEIVKLKTESALLRSQLSVAREDIIIRDNEIISLRENMAVLQHRLKKEA